MAHHEFKSINKSEIHELNRIKQNLYKVQIHIRLLQILLFDVTKVATQIKL